MTSQTSDSAKIIDGNLLAKYVAALQSMLDLTHSVDLYAEMWPIKSNPFRLTFHVSNHSSVSCKLASGLTRRLMFA